MKKKHPFLLALHIIIIVHFCAEILYTGYIVFFVLTPEGGGGPLMGQAARVPTDLLIRRRLYAIENWIATSGLVIYLALTEFLPRWKRDGSDHARPSGNR